MLDHVSSIVSLDKVNAWSDYQGDLFTLVKGENRFVLEFSGAGPVNINADYTTCYV